MWFFETVFRGRTLWLPVNRTRLEILAATAIAVSALALAIADPFSRPAETPPRVGVSEVPQPPPPPVAQPQVRPRVEVVFALDTTGSMGGLIDGAKQKIWSIANELASGQPRPDLHVGLVAYRDLGDEYVVRSTALSTDLDEVYAELMQLTADGGGDGPEHVNAALAQAIRGTTWSQGDEVLKIVFLVGDAPPHDDYDDGLNSLALAEEAKGRGILINTVRCGLDEATEAAWRQIARIAGGDFVSVAQDGGVQAIATPYDAELQALNAAIADTVVGYGSAQAQERSRMKVRQRHAMKSAEAAAAASFSAKAGRLNREDLVTAVEEGLALDSVAPEALPEELRGLPPEARRAAVEEKLARRKATQKRILEIAEKRDQYLERNAAAKDGFDERVLDIVRKQTAEIGVAY